MASTSTNQSQVSDIKTPIDIKDDNLELHNGFTPMRGEEVFCGNELFESCHIGFAINSSNNVKAQGVKVGLYRVKL